MIYSHHVNMNDVSCNEKNHFSLKYYMLAMGLFCASEMKKKAVSWPTEFVSSITDIILQLLTISWKYQYSLH